VVTDDRRALATRHRVADIVGAEIVVFALEGGVRDALARGTGRESTTQIARGADAAVGHRTVRTRDTCIAGVGGTGVVVGAAGVRIARERLPRTLTDAGRGQTRLAGDGVVLELV